jgi:hypothetical protein
MLTDDLKFNLKIKYIWKECKLFPPFQMLFRIPNNCLLPTTGHRLMKYRPKDFRLKDFRLGTPVYSRIDSQSLVSFRPVSFRLVDSFLLWNWLPDLFRQGYEGKIVAAARRLNLKGMVFLGF